MSSIPAGYKQTEVGVIPDEWGASSIGQVCTCFSGGTPSTSNPRYYGGDIPWITSSDLNMGRVSEVAGRITADGLANSAAKVVGEGTLLLALYGATAGVCAVSEIRAAINQAVLAILPQGIEREYLFQFFTFRKDHFIKTFTQGGQPNFSGEIVKSFLVSIPPLSEQQAIAEALSDADALLESLEQLLTKKRHLKQAAMQGLLTGKKRLPGFSGEWKLKQLGELCTMKSGAAITSANIDDYSEFPCYGGNGLRGYTGTYTHDGHYALIGRQGALCGNVVIVGGRFFASEHAVVVTPMKETDIQWLAVVLARMNLNQYSESSAQPGLSVSKLLVMPCTVPPLPEQSAIAVILAEMDAEIADLEMQLSKNRALKQGMMQKLLTGEIRIVTAPAKSRS